MATISASIFTALDGVVDPGVGNWHFPYFNEEMGSAVAETHDADVMLFGRVTYDSFAGAWPEREAAGGEDAEFAKALGDARKTGSATSIACRGRPSMSSTTSPSRTRRSTPSRAWSSGSSASGCRRTSRPSRVPRCRSEMTSVRTRARRWHTGSGRVGGRAATGAVGER